MTDAAGEPVDWILGYGYDPPADNFLAQLEKSLAGQDTFRSLSEKYAKNPKDIETVFKLAKKYNDRLIEDKTIEKYKEVLALDPEGKAGFYTLRNSNTSVPYVQYAEYAIGELGLFKGMSGKPNLDPFRAFVKKYPEGKLTKMVYGRMANYFAFSAPKMEADPFFAEYTAKYPNDVDAWHAWLSRIVKYKENLDKGVEIAAKIRELTDDDPLPRYDQAIAELYIARGNKSKAQEAYGKTYMENQASSLAYSLVGYADFWFKQGENKDSALEMAELAFKIYPENAYIRQQAASAYVQMNKLDRALEIYGPDFVEKNIDSVSPLRGYARFWATRGMNLDGALVAIRRLIVLAPDILWTWDAASAVYLKLKKYDDAVKASEKALTLADADNKEYLKKKLDQVKAAIEKEKAAEKN
jgi:tetratricopeptide (TPR) repeat protein